jgi:hypothetical protein
LLRPSNGCINSDPQQAQQLAATREAQTKHRRIGPQKLRRKD